LKLLFFCTGNYYRSRFAEALFNHAARRERLGWTAFSRGLAIHLADGDLSPHTERALDARKIDLIDTGVTRISLSEVDLLEASHIVALDLNEHRALMLRHFPEWADRVTYGKVKDIDQAEPDQALAMIEGLVHNLIKELPPVHDCGAMRSRQLRSRAPTSHP
jgi:protein-tyrosine phosphatase